MTLAEQINAIVANAVVALVGIAVTALVATIRARVKSRLAAEALTFLTTTAGTLVAATADEVRTMKDPLKPGSWTPQQAAAVKARVVRELRQVGGGALERLRATNGLSPESVTMLLEQLVEEQVEGMRRWQPRELLPASIEIPRESKVPASIAPTGGA